MIDPTMDGIGIQIYDWCQIMRVRAQNYHVVITDLQSAEHLLRELPKGLATLSRAETLLPPLATTPPHLRTVEVLVAPRLAEIANAWYNLCYKPVHGTKRVPRPEPTMHFNEWLKLMTHAHD